MALKIKGLKAVIESKDVLKGVDLTIEPGEIVALMGPNGSGKSSLAYTIAGHPNYEVTDGEISMDEEDLLEKTPDERAKLGLFLAFQYPIGIPGVSVREMLLSVLRERQDDPKKVSAMDLKKQLEAEAKELAMSPELLTRGLNEGFSGGEKKKMEIMQLRVLKPKYAILDETDSGLDIDALKVVAEGAREAARKNNVGTLVITHYQRILKYLKPDRVVVLKEGVIVAEGKQEIIDKLESEGYKSF